jgi:hypothetical protein
MRRGYIAIILLLLSSLACSLFGSATQAPPVATSSLPQITASPKAQVTASPQSQITASPSPQGTSTSQPGITQPAATQSISTPTAVTPTKTPYPTSVLDAALTSQINQIQSQVVQERELQPKESVPVVLLSPDQLRQNTINDYQSGYSDQQAADDVIELSAIGLLNPGFNLRQLMIDLQSEEVAGYYDNDTKEMFVVQGEGFQGPERLTYSHEYTHALQDQNYDIKNGLNYNDAACKENSEHCAAVQALLEGDATVSQILWYQNYATNLDKKQINNFYNTFQSPVLDGAPAFLKDDFSFPYDQGEKFVEDLYTQGGWQAVDAVYQDPPVSTEQILHPNLYPSDTPIPVKLPDLTTTLGQGWRESARDQMGEWYTYLVLARGVNENARLDDKTAQSAAAGWGGDNYVVLHNDTTGQTAFVMKTVWDTTNDASEFASAFEKYATTRFGVNPTQQGNTTTWTYDGGVTSLYLSGDTTIWITAPDETSMQSLTGAVQQ